MVQVQNTSQKIMNHCHQKIKMTHKPVTFFLSSTYLNGKIDKRHNNTSTSDSNSSIEEYDQS